MRKYLRVDEDLDLDDDIQDSPIKSDLSASTPPPFEQREPGGISIVRNRLT